MVLLNLILRKVLTRPEGALVFLKLEPCVCDSEVLRVLMDNVGLPKKVGVVGFQVPSWTRGLQNFVVIIVVLKVVSDGTCVLQIFGSMGTEAPSAVFLPWNCWVLN